MHTIFHGKQRCCFEDSGLYNALEKNQRCTTNKKTETQNWRKHWRYLASSNIWLFCIPDPQCTFSTILSNLFWWTSGMATMFLTKLKQSLIDPKVMINSLRFNPWNFNGFELKKQNKTQNTYFKDLQGRVYEHLYKNIPVSAVQLNSF